MKKIIILATLLSGCVTMDKLKTEDCSEVINRSKAVDESTLLVNSDNGLIVLCSIANSCCLAFIDEAILDQRDLPDGTCYRGDTKYYHKTFCGENK